MVEAAISAGVYGMAGLSLRIGPLPTTAQVRMVGFINALRLSGWVICRAPNVQMIPEHSRIALTSTALLRRCEATHRLMPGGRCSGIPVDDIRNNVHFAHALFCVAGVIATASNIA